MEDAASEEWGGALDTDCRAKQAERPSEILCFESYTGADSTTINQHPTFRTHVKKPHESCRYQARSRTHTFRRSVFAGQAVPEDSGARIVALMALHLTVSDQHGGSPQSN